MPQADSGREERASPTAVHGTARWPPRACWSSMASRRRPSTVNQELDGVLA